MTAFDSERGDFDMPPAGSTSLSDDDFSDLTSEDSDSGCESEGESDDGSVDEDEDVPMPKLMDLLDSGGKEGYTDIPTSIFTLGYDTYTTTFGSAAPNVVVSDSGAVTSYLRLDCGSITLDELAESGLTVTLSCSWCVIRGPDGQTVQTVNKVPWNANGLDGIEHEQGQANAEAEPYTLDWFDPR